MANLLERNYAHNSDLHCLSLQAKLRDSSGHKGYVQSLQIFLSLHSAHVPDFFHLSLKIGQ